MFASCKFVSSIHKSFYKNAIVTLYHVIHIKIKYFLRQRTLKTMSLAGTLNNSDVILWTFARGNLRILISDFSFLLVLVSFTPFSLSQMKGCFATRVTERKREREKEGCSNEGFCEPWDCEPPDQYTVE